MSDIGGGAPESAKKKRKPRAGKAPAYQWYPGDALADEAMSTMDLEEEGAFRRLLDHHYREGSIPADHEELRRLCKWITAHRFEKVWKRIGKCFTPDPENATRLVNARAVEQRKALDNFVESSAAGGVAAAENMTPEQRSERASKAAKSRHSDANEQAGSKQEPAKAVLAAANTASAIASSSSSGSTEPERSSPDGDTAPRGRRRRGQQRPTTTPPAPKPPPLPFGAERAVDLVAAAAPTAFVRPDTLLAAGQVIRIQAHIRTYGDEALWTLLGEYLESGRCAIKDPGPSWLASNHMPEVMTRAMAWRDHGKPPAGVMPARPGPAHTRVPQSGIGATVAERVRRDREGVDPFAPIKFRDDPPGGDAASSAPAPPAQKAAS